MNFITHISVRQEAAMIETLAQTQYVRTTKALEFDDHRGRTTHLVEGLPGFILDEGNMEDVCENEKEKAKCQSLLDKAKEAGGDQYASVLMLQGYPCLVPVECFIKCDA